MWIWPAINESMSRLCASPFWDSNVTWNTPDPDFTPCFEKTFLVWFPCLFLWLFLPLEVYNLRCSKARDIPVNLYNLSKLVLIVLIGLPSSIKIVYFVFFDDTELLVDILSPVVEFFTFCLLFVLTSANRKYGIQSSGVQFMFSLLLALFKAPQFRTELKLPSNINVFYFISNLIQFRQGGILHLENVSVWTYPLVLLLLILNCFSDALPNFQMFPVDEDVYPEYHSSFLSQIFFAWFDTFIWKGYRKSLTDKDLWNLEHEAKSAQISYRFESQWSSALERSKKETVNTNVSVYHENEELLRNEIISQEPRYFEEAAKKASIVGPLCKTFGPYFMISVLLELGLIGLTFASPQILKEIIGFIGDKNEYSWHGYFYAILLFVVVVLETLLSERNNHIVTTVGLYVRTSLTSLIYKKSLKISTGTRRNFTVGEIINLMAVDVQRFTDLLASINVVWSVPVKIFLTSYFLWAILGPSVLAGIAVMITIIPVNGLLASKAKILQAKQMEYKDERIKVINETLSGIKVLKLYAWEPCFEKHINRVRAKEMAILKTIRYVRTASAFLWACTPFLVSSTTFAVFVLSSDKNILDAQVAFVSLSLFNILRSPMAMLPFLITSMAQAAVSVKRINRFLNSEELDPNAASHQHNLEPVTVENGQFSWEGYDGPSVLNYINVKVRSGQLVAVVGSVGSGKSSLLHAILGDMYKQSGSVNTSGRLAYVPQQAWIRNTTFKDNITFGDLSNQSCYEEILEACALNADLKTLPKGDKTLIGEKGINLSGGQKQRVSLARAVYAEADIYLMDDPLSSVDSHVGRHLFERIIGPSGMLNRKTRVLVTHNVTYLPQVDFIIVMKNGIISESGTYHELEQKGGNFSEFLATYVKNERNEVDGAIGIENLRQEVMDQESNNEGDAAVISGNRERTASLPEDIGETIEQNSDEIERIETGNVDRKVFVYYFSAMGLIFITVTVLMNIVFHVFLVASNFWLTVWTNDTSAALDMAKKSFYLGVYGLFGLGQAFSQVIRFLCLFYGAVKASLKIHTHLLESFLRWPMHIFDITPAGRILNRFSNDVDVMDMELPSHLDSFIYDTCSIISTFIVISYTTPQFIIVTIPVGIIYFFLQRFYVATSRQLRRLESVSRSPIYSQSGETILGAQSIRAYGLQAKFIQIFEDKLDCNQKSYYSSAVSSRWLSIRLEIIGDLVIFFSALFTVSGRDTLSPGLAALSVTYALQIMEAFNGMLRHSSELETNIVAIERIREYKEIQREAPWIEKDESVSADWPETGDISVENFHGRYREGLQLVLKGITFHVRGSEKVGIVGRTGAGKTSLSLGLFRIIESEIGKISIDNVDISKIGLHTLRNRLTTIPQDPVLFSGTLRFNLDPMEEYSDECIWRALELAHMKTYVSGLSFGLQSEVAESGDNFSVGQRQLICLARALLRKTKILILDEATAAIDLVIDDLIQATIRKEFKDCTVLTIAHRINTILDYDRIIVMEGGRVMEFDSPEMLLKSKNSVFYQMALQAGAI